MANVHLLGHKPYRQLPGYCRGLDVGIIPFRLNTLTLRANPPALGQRSEAMARRRVEAMRAESWTARVEEISALLAGRPGAAA